VGKPWGIKSRVIFTSRQFDSLPKALTRHSSLNYSDFIMCFFNEDDECASAESRARGMQSHNLRSRGYQRLMFRCGKLRGNCPESVLYPGHRRLSRLSQSTPLSVSNMSEPSSSSSFQVLFNAALQEYESQTGTSLVDHPFVKQLEECDSVDSVATILQEQSQSFREFRGGDGKLMKSLMRSVDVLYTISTNTALGEGIGLVRPKVLIGIHCS
jgi:hypothetical protein